MKKSKGFGLIQLVIVVVVIAAIAAAGVFVYQHNHKKTNNSASSTATSQANANTKTVDPYAGWKTYCDTNYKYCFKYPTNWSIDTSSSSQTTLLNSDKSIEIDYINPYILPSINI